MTPTLEIQRPFSLHESTADSEFLHGFSVYSVYNKALLIFEAPIYGARAQQDLSCSSDPPSKERVVCTGNCKTKSVSQSSTCRGRNASPAPRLRSLQPGSGLRGTDMGVFCVHWRCWWFGWLGWFGFFCQLNHPFISQAGKWHQVNIIQ